MSDPERDQTHSCALLENPFQTFEIILTSSAGKDLSIIRVKQNMYLNYEFVSVMDVVVQCNDSGIPMQSFQKQFTINITDVNDRPHYLSISNYRVAENAAAGELVGTFRTRDSDRWDVHFDYELVRGKDYFQLVKNQLFTKITFDYEKRDSYRIAIRSTDSAGNGCEKGLTV